MGTTRNVDMSANQPEVKVVKAETPDTKDSSTTTAESEKKVVKKKVRHRSKKYQAVRAQVDKTRHYDLRDAVEMVKKLSYSKFDNSIEAHLVLREVGTSAKLSLPHSTGKTKKVVIMSDAVLKDIEAGNIDFDVLISSPEFMPKLAKHARVLGPKGLMPNPKTGTLTPNPELKKKEFEAGSFTLKTDKKAPLINLSVGKASMETDAIVENVHALLKAFKGKVEKLSISATMSPGVKVALEK